MEINRKLLRKQAWESLKGIYWFMFLACLIAGLVGVKSSGFSISTSFGTNNTNNIIQGNDSSQVYSYTFDEVEPHNLAEFFGMVKSAYEEVAKANPVLRIFWPFITAIIMLSVILGILFSIFISGPAEVSFAKVKLEAVVNRNKNGRLAFFAFKNGYINMVKTMLLKNFILFLWGLLPAVAIIALTLVSMYMVLVGNYMFVFIFLLLLPIALLLEIPLIIKRYQYLFVPYIMAEMPETTPTQALRLSTEMMKGFKWQTFLLVLSFIGWIFLGLLLCGVGIIFVNPYYHATETLLYKEIKAYYYAPVPFEAVVSEQ